MLAIAGEWGAYLTWATDRPEAGSKHLDHARAVLAYARVALGAEGAKWLDSALASGLPETAGDLVPESQGVQSGTQKPKAFLGTPFRRISSVALLTAVRDAQAGDLKVIAGTSGLGAVWAGSSVPDFGHTTFPHVSTIGACIHDTTPLEALPEGRFSEGQVGLGPPDSPAGPCQQLVVQSWNAYRATGSAMWHKAALDAWQQLRTWDPNIASSTSSLYREILAQLH